MSNTDDPSGSRWPSLQYKELQWDTDPTVPVSRTARRQHRGPYQAAIVPKIAKQRLSLPSATMAVVDDAAAEISRFDAELGSEIARFAAVLLRSESASSSRIENLTASARAIAEAELHGHGGQNASLIVANERAMNAAIAMSDRIDAASILAMHEALLGSSNPRIAGQWRDEQVWVGGSDVGPHRAEFVPPHHSRVEAAIDDLIGFIDRDDVPVLAHAAIAHAQFETIHPFADGNGRCGRALLQAQLRNKALTRNVTVPVSAGLLSETDAYFAALTAYRVGDPATIVDQLARAAIAAVGNGRTLVSELRAVRSGWDARVRARRDSAAWRIADLLVRRPVVNASLLASELGIAQQNTYRSIAPLIEFGVVVEFTDQKRNQMWRSQEVIDALDRFAERAGRRTRTNG